MPKKTREEKVISANRKKLRLLQQLNEPQVLFDKPEVKKTQTESVSPVESQPDTKEIALKTYFSKDLRKSLFLVALIIALEIIIYFGTINHYLKL